MRCTLGWVQIHECGCRHPRIVKTINQIFWHYVDCWKIFCSVQFGWNHAPLEKSLLHQMFGNISHFGQKTRVWHELQLFRDQTVLFTEFKEMRCFSKQNVLLHTNHADFFMLNNTSVFYSFLEQALNSSKFRFWLLYFSVAIDAFNYYVCYQMVAHNYAWLLLTFPFQTIVYADIQGHVRFIAKCCILNKLDWKD